MDSAPPLEPKPPVFQRLTSIDVLRGVAALGVLVYHDALRIWPASGPNPTNLWSWVAPVLLFGSAGVHLFFVISGFCIHLRYAKSLAKGDAGLPEFIPFWKRRFRRLYPPYLAAMAVYLLVTWVQGKLVFNGFFWYDLFSHLGMVHNLDTRTVFSMNGVFWTLAIEEQLYLLYFVLIRVRLRFGWPAALLMCAGARAAAFIAFFVVRRVFHIEFPVSESAFSNWLPWALGALSVEAAVGIVKMPPWARDLRVGFAVLFGAFMLGRMDQLFEPLAGVAKRVAWVGMPVLYAVGFWILVNGCVAREPRTSSTSLVWKGLAATGLFSYSLYLIHELPLHYALPLFARVLPQLDLTQQVLLLTPLTIGLAWLFHLAFERPFMPGAALDKAR